MSAEMKAAAKTALALLTATAAGLNDEASDLVADEPAPALVLSALAGMAAGILLGWDDAMPGCGRTFLERMGARIESGMS